MSSIKLVRPIAVTLTVIALGLAGCSSLQNGSPTDFSNSAGPIFSPVY